jgi:hypothetical protein
VVFSSSLDTTVPEEENSTCCKTRRQRMRRGTV